MLFITIVDKGYIQSTIMTNNNKLPRRTALCSRTAKHIKNEL